MRKLFVARVETERLKEAAELHSGAEKFWCLDLAFERRTDARMEPLGSICLVLSVFAMVSKWVLTQFLCDGMPRSAHGTAEVGASSGRKLGRSWRPHGRLSASGLLVDVAHKANGRRACAAREGDAGDLSRFGRGRRHFSRGGYVGPA